MSFYYQLRYLGKTVSKATEVSPPRQPYGVQDIPSRKSGEIDALSVGSAYDFSDTKKVSSKSSRITRGQISWELKWVNVEKGKPYLKLPVHSSIKMEIADSFKSAQDILHVISEEIGTRFAREFKW